MGGTLHKNIYFFFDLIMDDLSEREKYPIESKVPKGGGGWPLTLFNWRDPYREFSRACNKEHSQYKGNYVNSALKINNKK